MSGLRVGDVVLRAGDPVERTVLEMYATGNPDITASVKIAVGMSATWGGARDLTLLRRPVQVGDVLRWKDGTLSGTRTVKSITAEMVCSVECGALCEPNDLATSCVHADGTAIEPPKPVEPDPEGWGGTSGFRRPVYSVNSPKPFAAEPQADVEGLLASVSGNAEVSTLTHPDLSPGESTLYERGGASTTLHANGSITLRHGRPLRITIAVTADRLARALFETDDDVIRLVTLRSENDVSTRRADVMQRCWDRGHAGESPEWKWYVRAADRAKAMTEKLGGRT